MLNYQTGSPPPCGALPTRITNPRIAAAYQLGMSKPTLDAILGPAVNLNNGDKARYAGKGGARTYRPFNVRIARFNGSIATITKTGDS